MRHTIAALLIVASAACDAPQDYPSVAASAIPPAPEWLDDAGDELEFHAILLLAHHGTACAAAQAGSGMDVDAPAWRAVQRENVALCDAYSVALEEAKTLYTQTKSTEMFGFDILHTDSETQQVEKRMIGPFGTRGMCEQYESKVRVEGVETMRCRPMR